MTAYVARVVAWRRLYGLVRLPSVPLVLGIEGVHRTSRQMSMLGGMPGGLSSSLLSLLLLLINTSTYLIVAPVLAIRPAGSGVVRLRKLVVRLTCVFVRVDHHVQPACTKHIFKLSSILCVSCPAYVLTLRMETPSSQRSW